MIRCWLGLSIDLARAFFFRSFCVIRYAHELLKSVDANRTRNPNQKISMKSGMISRLIKTFEKYQNERQDVFSSNIERGSDFLETPVSILF